MEKFSGSRWEFNGRAKPNKEPAGMARAANYLICPLGLCFEDRQYYHPAMYPRGVPEYVIKLMTEPRDLVVDPFAGSGTTGRVANMLDRRYIGFEIKQEYADYYVPPETDEVT